MNVTVSTNVKAKTEKALITKRLTRVDLVSNVYFLPNIASNLSFSSVGLHFKGLDVF